jgi:hypothetical protein
VALSRVILPLVLLLGAGAFADDLDAPAVEALASGQAAQAVAICDSALATHPGEPGLLAVRGEAELVLGRVAAARRDLHAVAKRSRRWRGRVADPLSRAELLHGNDDAAEDLVRFLELPAAAALEVVIHGPFGARLGEVAAVASGRTEHYLVFSDVGLTDGVVANLRARGEPFAPCRSVREVGRLLEASRRACQQIFPVPDTNGLVLRAYVFRSQEEFQLFGELLQGETPRDDDGDFYEELRVIAVNAMGGLGEDARDTIFHESFHQLVSFYAPSIPTWLDEGLAEWFGAVTDGPSGELVVGALKKSNDETETRYETITTALKEGKALPLGDFVALDDDGFQVEDDLDRNYAEGWSIAHFLMAKHRPLLTEFLRLLHEGRTQEDAFAATFGEEDLDALDKEWRRYVLGL